MQLEELYSALANFTIPGNAGNTVDVNNTPGAKMTTALQNMTDADRTFISNYTANIGNNQPGLITINTPVAKPVTSPAPVTTKTPATTTAPTVTQPVTNPNISVPGGTSKLDASLVSMLNGNSPQTPKQDVPKSSGLLPMLAVGALLLLATKK